VFLKVNIIKKIMAVNYILSDLYSRIKNGNKAKLESIVVLKSKLVIKVLDILFLEGFIRGYTFNAKESNKIIVLLKYSLDGKSVIKHIKGISKPGKRVYIGVDSLWNIYSESDTICLILSTSKGVMCLKEALNKNIGGEPLCVVF
jgi:small subunit ribosomal protein S8